MLVHHVYPLTLYPLTLTISHPLYFICARVLGTNIQSTSNNPIIAINLQIHQSTPSQAPVSKRIKPLYTVPPRAYKNLKSITHSGCKLPIPFPVAIAPAMNGNAAAPAALKLVM